MQLSKNQLNKILAVDPFNSRANELLAYILANEGELVKAHELLLIANRDINSSAESSYYLGVSYIKRNDYENAIKYIKLSLSKNGNFFEGLIDLAIAYGNIGDLKKAEDILLEAIKLYPLNKFIAYVNIGRLKSKQKEYDQALFYFNKALQIDSKSEEVLINISTAYYDAGKYKESLDVLFRIMEINKNNVKAIINIAATLNMLDKYSESMEWSKKLIKSKNELALINYAESLSGLTKYKEALEIYNNINESSKNYTKALNNKGVIFNKLNEYENALSCFNELIRINNLDDDAMSNKAKVLNEICNYEEALNYINKAISISNNKINSHLVKAFILFNIEDYENAWIEYEWRNKKNEENEKIILIKKLELWNGINRDKKLIIWGEQGLGDQILFSSVLKEIIELKIYPTIIINKKMVKVFEHSFPDCRFISLTENIELSEYGYQISIVSLQMYFRKKMSDFKKIVTPYISYKKNNTILNNENKIICGLTWLSFSKEIGSDKSIPIEELEILFCINKIKFIDIQYYPPNENVDPNIERYKIDKIANANFYEDFELLVQVIDKCDIIITCSNTTAHVAGAMGKKTYLMLPRYKGRHWYWKHVNGKNIFYPTITVLEQKKNGSWNEPIQELKEILEKI